MGRILKAAASPQATPLEPATADREPMLAEATFLLASARAAAKAEWAAAKRAAPVLARKMAERIIGRAVELDDGVMADIAAKALAASQARQSPVVLRVHPDDSAALERTRPRWQASLLAVDVHVVEDPSVGRHGCVVETPVGRVDARLETQLDALERALRESLGRT